MFFETQKKKKKKKKKDFARYTDDNISNTCSSNTEEVLENLLQGH